MIIEVRQLGGAKDKSLFFNKKFKLFIFHILSFSLFKKFDPNHPII